jgi:hypothetical protein
MVYSKAHLKINGDNGGNRHGRGVNHRTPSGVEVKDQLRTMFLLLSWIHMACSRVKLAFIIQQQEMGGSIL